MIYMLVLLMVLAGFLAGYFLSKTTLTILTFFLILFAIYLALEERASPTQFLLGAVVLLSTWTTFYIVNM